MQLNLGKKTDILIAKGRYQTAFAKNKVQSCHTSNRVGGHATQTFQLILEYPLRRQTKDKYWRHISEEQKGLAGLL